MRVTENILSFSFQFVAKNKDDYDKCELYVGSEGKELIGLFNCLGRL